MINRSEIIGSGFNEANAAGVLSLQEIRPQVSVGIIQHSDKLREAISNNKLGGFFEELADTYRNAYSGAPWQEHLICSDKTCGNKTGLPNGVSFEDADQAFEENPLNFCCIKCQAPMEFFYDPRQTISGLQEAFQDEVFASLLFIQDVEGRQELGGFSLGWGTNVQQGYQDKVVVGAGDAPAPTMSYDDYLGEFQSAVGMSLTEDQKIFNSAEWAVVEGHRSSGGSKPLLYHIYSTAQQRLGNAPVIGHTMKDSKALAVFESIGFTAGTIEYLPNQVRVYSTLSQLIQGTQKPLKSL